MDQDAKPATGIPTFTMRPSIMAQTSSSSSSITRRIRTTEGPTVQQEEDPRAEKKVPPCQRSRSSPLLPIWELLLYTLVVVAVYGYATYKLYKESQDFQKKTINGRGLLQPGWEILGRRYQDIKPPEWSHWIFFTLHTTSLSVYAGHLVGGFIISKYLPNLRRGFLILSSLLGTAIIVSPEVFGLILCHAILAYLVAVIGGRIWLIWIVGLSQLAMAVMSPFSRWQISQIPGTREYKVKFIIAMAFCCLRMIAFGVGYVKKKEKAREEKVKDESRKNAEESWTILDYLLYVFYLPTSTHGPFMRPEVFFLQIKRPYYPSSLKEVRWVAVQWLRPLLAAILLEFILHYLYITSFFYLPQYLKTMPIIALIALGEWCLIIFQIQYIVYYGFGRAMAIFDGVLTPSVPSCMQTMVSATYAWRYFDRGEYQFILRNIYIPLGGSQYGGLRRYLALIVSYCFSAFWHGFNYNTIVMVMIFWVLVQWEAFSPILAKKLGIQQQVEQFSPLMRRRLGCILPGGKYPIMVLSVVFFINSIEVGMICINRVIGAEDALWVVTGLVAVHYCHVQLLEECFSRWGEKYIMEKHYNAPPQL